MTRSIRFTSLVFVALATHASAQPAPARTQPTPQQLDEARSHFKAAEEAKARGDFKTAAVEYLAAYERFQDPEFFFNVAEVYRMANDEPTALSYYEKYLELDPLGRGAASAHTEVEVLRKSIAAKADAAQKQGDDAARVKPQDDVKQNASPATGAVPRPEMSLSDSEPELVDDSQPAQANGRGLRIAGIATAGAGVAALGIGVAFGIQARSVSKEAASWEMFDRARYAQGQAAERNMYILTGIGGAAVIAGAVLYVLGHRAGASAVDNVALVPAHNGLTAVGRF